jgi:hypothetical protein
MGIFFIRFFFIRIFSFSLTIFGTNADAASFVSAGCGRVSFVSSDQHFDRREIRRHAGLRD